MDEVMAEALAIKIAEITAIDSLIQAAEDRRYTALQELDRRRAMFAQSTRRFVHDLEASEVKALNGNGKVSQVTTAPIPDPNMKEVETGVSP